jgi:putative hydrolase
MTRRPNDDVADRLDEIGALLGAQGANPYRVRAYRRAAEELRQLTVPVSAIVAQDGVSGLDRLRHIGPSLARTIRDIVVHGYSPMMERLRGETDPIRLFESVPGVGARLAARLHNELGLDTLQQLEAAACDGRLEQIAGFGPKRLRGVRDSLAQRLGRVHAGDVSDENQAAPAVAELLDVDQEYLTKARGGELPRIAPRRFNPQGAAWLPILHADRDGRHYTALFSNTARAHRLGKTDDWVVVYCDDGAREHQWTMITAAFGPLRGKRIIRGREAECAAFYGVALRPGEVDSASRQPVPSDLFTSQQFLEGGNTRR